MIPIEPARTSFNPVLATDAEAGADPRTVFERIFPFEAPYLGEKALAKGVVTSQADFLECFTELKKYFALSTAGKQIGMVSERIDELWHLFILFTLEYHQFCNRYFGRYLHHKPDVKTSPVPPAAYWEFVTSYRDHFGPLPSIWGVVDHAHAADGSPEDAAADCMGCTHCMGCSMPGCSGCMTPGVS